MLLSTSPVSVFYSDDANRTSVVGLAGGGSVPVKTDEKPVRALLYSLFDLLLVSQRRANRVANLEGGECALNEWNVFTLDRPECDSLATRDACAWHDHDENETHNLLFYDKLVEDDISTHMITYPDENATVSTDVFLRLDRMGCMDIEPFALERWFAAHEHEADIMLAESGIRSLRASRFDLDAGDLGYVIPTNGDPAFREEIAARYDREEDEVLFTCGAQEANFLAFLSLLNEGDHAVVITPTYQSLHSVPESLAKITRVGLEPPEWTLDPDAVAEAMRSETALVVVNNPNNPTGRYHLRETIDALYEIAADHGAYLLCDEVYRLLAEDPLPPVASMGPYGISTTSLTKAYGLAGLRFGWLAGPPEVINAAWNWKDYTTISPSPIGQYVARQALETETEREILDENRTLARENRDITSKFLDRHDLDWFEPVGVNGFVTVPDGFATGQSFCERVIQEESVVLAPGGAFGHPDRFRIGFGLESETLAEGLSRLDSFFERHV